MPPKKSSKSGSTVVLGTVSTRSTRRQSVVSIDIPKTNPNQPTEKKHKKIAMQKPNISYTKRNQEAPEGRRPATLPLKKDLRARKYIAETVVKEPPKVALQEIIDEWTSDEETQDNSDKFNTDRNIAETISDDQSNSQATSKQNSDSDSQNLETTQTSHLLETIQDPRDTQETIQEHIAEQVQNSESIPYKLPQHIKLENLIKTEDTDSDSDQNCGCAIIAHIKREPQLETDYTEPLERKIKLEHYLPEKEYEFVTTNTSCEERTVLTVEKTVQTDQIGEEFFTANEGSQDFQPAEVIVRNEGDSTGSQTETSNDTFENVQSAEEFEATSEEKSMQLSPRQEPEDQVNESFVEDQVVEEQVVIESTCDVMEHKDITIEEQVFYEDEMTTDSNCEKIMEEQVTDEDHNQTVNDSSDLEAENSAMVEEEVIESSCEDHNQYSEEQVITEEQDSNSEAQTAEEQVIQSETKEESVEILEPSLDVVEANLQAMNDDVNSVKEEKNEELEEPEIAEKPEDTPLEDKPEINTEICSSGSTEVVKSSEDLDLEKKVAELHLKDPEAPDEMDFVEKVAELNLNATSNIENLEKILSENLPPESTVEEAIVEPKKPTRPLRTRRTKSAEPKQKPAPKPKEIKPKVPKEPKATKAKEKKPKTEPKEAKPKEKKPPSKTPKKPPANKKPKDTPEAKPEETQKEKKPSKDKQDVDLEDIEVRRRSSRLKSISNLNKKTTGRGVVKSKSEQLISELEMSDSNSNTFTESEKSTPSASPKPTSKERKTRWNKPDGGTGTTGQPENQTFAMDQDMNFLINNKPNKTLAQDPVVEERLKQYVHLKENLYKTDRLTCKEAKKMTCDCFLTPEEIQGDEYGCGEDCLNRLLLIECGDLCPVGERCTNKRFQKNQFAPVEVFNTEKKGLGLRAAANIPYGEFILEYIGEVLDINEFDKRAEVYSQDKNIHYYFMALRADAIIDATMKGNISRFINHSCDPNAETQKWTVNGQLRIGFFSTRTIFAGEEITFDYQFQRYGKEAQKCFCETAICRGWLGEQPDSEEEEDEEDEEEEEEEEEAKVDTTTTEGMTKTQLEQVLSQETPTVEDVKTDESTPVAPATPATASPVKIKKKVQKKKKKARIELFEEIDQLNEEIEMLMTTGLKNQTQTLKLSRLMVRAQEPQQRQKLLRVLRRGELPCKRLFLDYHGLRLMHGYLIDAQHLVKTDKSYESIRLEMLQTLAVLPIANKTMLKDSKVLSTVEKWATDKALTSPLDSDSNSPMTESDSTQPPKKEIKVESDAGRSIEEQEEEIRFLASKLLEEWSNLKEVFRIPKKERIEQMKEHEREANKKFMQNSYGLEQDKDRKGDRYRTLSRLRLEKENIRNKSYKGVEKYSAEFLKLSKFERRKLFALQHELKEEERRLKQREMWRQHEINCMMIGTDPRFTAPFDPSKPFQFIWNPQIGQWQSYPLPQSSPLLNPQHPMQSMMHMSHMPKTTPYQYSSPISQVATVPQMNAVMPTVLSSHSQLQLTQTQVNPLSNLHSPLQQNLTSIPNQYTTQVPLGQYPDQQIKEEDDVSQVKFLGPIPPPVTLPPKWKCAKDKYGRPYYYHIKLRKSQWEPPPLPEPAAEEPGESSESESSSDTSSLSSDSSSDNTDSEDEIDDTKLLIEVRRQMEKTERAESVSAKPPSPEEEPPDEDSPPTAPGTATPSPDDGNILEDMEIMMEQEVIVDETTAEPQYGDDETERPSIDIRLKEQFALLTDEQPPRKKRRFGLCEEIIIPPRTQEDIIQSKEDLKRYKANKEKVRKQKELKKQLKEVVEPKRPKEKSVRTSLKAKIKDMPEFNSEAARKIKETFRANMASTVVNALNFYRKPDCKEGKITNIDDFKHLARKLTHFVMLKEMKHIARIEDLLCTDNVKMKARDYIRKYMSKFGEVYIKRSDSPDFKD